MENGYVNYFEGGFCDDLSTAMSFAIGILGSYTVHQIASAPASTSPVRRTNDAACLHVIAFDYVKLVNAEAWITRFGLS